MDKKNVNNLVKETQLLELFLEMIDIVNVQTNYINELVVTVSGLSKNQKHFIDFFEKIDEEIVEIKSNIEKKFNKCDFASKMLDHFYFEINKKISKNNNIKLN